MSSNHNTDKQINDFWQEVMCNPNYGGTKYADTWTEDEWEDEMVKWKCMDDAKKARFDKKCREYKKRSGQQRTQMVNIAFDQALGHQETVDAMLELLEAIKNTDYAKTLDCPKARCEFFSTSGYNPHIHLFTYCVGKPPSATAQAIRKKVALTWKIDPKAAEQQRCPVYRVEVTSAKGNSQLDYVNGIKADEEKDEYMKKDDAFRQKYGMDEVYNLS